MDPELTGAGAAAPAAGAAAMTTAIQAQVRTMPEPQRMDLFALGKRVFEGFSAELSRHGIATSPDLSVRRGDGVMSHYSLPDRKIYLSVPDHSTPVGELQAMVLASVLCCEVFQLFELFIPRLIAHEMAHHLRHLHGRFGNSPWEEEQVANRFAAALTKRRMAPAERLRARGLLERILTSLAGKIDVKDAATMSYHDVLYALNAEGRVGDTTVERAHVAQKFFDAETQRMLAASGDMPTAVHRDMDMRQVLIRDINTQYAGDFLKYVYYHAGWLHLDLGSHDTEYVDALAREHLGRSIPLLPVISAPESPSEETVAAYYRAFIDCREVSAAASRYFYKRYRTLLWSKLQEGGLLRPSDAEILKQQSAFFLESWDENASDALKYVAHLATDSVRALFPGRLRKRLKTLPAVEGRLLAEADVRLYRHVVEQAVDPAAAQTLYRLSLLEHSEVFRAVPAESLLALSYVLARVYLDAGETLFWENERNDDVFLLASGELESLVAGAHSGIVVAGAVFGETAFFSGRARHATVRARVPSECFVIKNVDLLSLAFRHPSVLIQMGGALARRLEDLDHLHATEADEAMTLRFPAVE
jgi:hypothetical protein